ncbi:hypothetical protein CANINC_003270 [Pichia inconspicua]|uniref:Uncharacterized protein n=1 Tax=Pichia inconspicua TaxID=52247 RepID=A0A4T0WZ75_9ASCO|nr:hypothetical protein CANINC_003270 [[Candida] inconspicua]
MLREKVVSKRHAARSALKLLNDPRANNNSYIVVSRTARDSPGSTACILKIFHRNQEDSEINEMTIKVSAQEYYSVKVRINTVLSDIIAVNKLTETKGPTARHPCTYCINEVTALYRIFDKKLGALEEPHNAKKLFSPDSLKTPIKAADLRTIAPVLYCFFDFVYRAGDVNAASQVYANFANQVLSQQGGNEGRVNQDTTVPQSVDANAQNSGNIAVEQEEDPGSLSASDFSDDFRDLVYQIVELNTYLQAMCSFDVPLNLIKVTYKEPTSLMQ